MPATLDQWLAHIGCLHAAPIALGLDRVIQVKEAMGWGAPRVPVITVGGTNGKGSTCAYLERILRSAGYRTGLYTSPHLLRYNERVRIDGAPATDETLCAAFAQVEAARTAEVGVALTYFEFGTLAAWQVFESAPLDVVILEVGLGGRLDAVNVFDPDCVVITGIDIDHTEFLGTTREAIGREKAGVFRPGRPAIVGDPQPPRSVLEAAEAVGADLRLLGRDFGVTATDRLQWTYQARRRRRSGLAHPALRGACQLHNAAAALAALDALAERLPVSMDAIRRGLIEVELPGRFQVLPGRPAVVLDVAHNPQAARVLAENLGDMGCFAETHAVFGMLRDKDVAGVVRALAPRVDHWHLADLDGARGASAGDLAQRMADIGVGNVAGRHANPVQAWRAARERAGEDDRILIFGSFLTVSDVLRAIGNGER